jgi:hypothetical protein
MLQVALRNCVSDPKETWAHRVTDPSKVTTPW